MPHCLQSTPSMIPSSPPINFIALSSAAAAAAAAAEPTPCGWKTRRDYSSCPHRAAARQELVFHMLMEWHNQSGSMWPYLLCHLLRRQDGPRLMAAIDSKLLITRKTPADTKRERREHCIIFFFFSFSTPPPPAVEHSALLNHAEVRGIGPTGGADEAESFNRIYRRWNCSFFPCTSGRDVFD